MLCKVTSLGVLLSHPLGSGGPFQTLRQYVIEAADGRIDMMQEWDEPELPSGEYDFPEEALAPIFDRQVELREDEW